MFVSHKEEIESILIKLLLNDSLHALWLNTLSYLENCGARKIASCEHPAEVKEEMLKHAAEEFRHAYYLKRQLSKLGQHLEDYRLSYLLGGWRAFHYVNSLDLQISRLLSRKGNFNEYAYLLVTYAIELRARELYPIYQRCLKATGSKVLVASIVLEEEEHLNEIEAQLARMENAEPFMEESCKIEGALFARWMAEVKISLSVKGLNF
jgi:bacterioferritin (cytochrome b1)